MGVMLNEDWAPLPPPNPLKLRALLIAMTLALAACGGGDWEDDGAGLQPVDCKAKPEQCR